MTLTSALPRAGALAAALLLTALAAPAPAQPAAEPAVLSVGHTDAMRVTYEHGKLGLRVKDDTGDAVKFHDPADVVFQVLPHAEMAIPEGGVLDFIGAPGDPIWLLPFTQDHTLLWPGWSTEELDTGTFKDDKVSMRLVGAEGPGEVALWGLGNFGTPNVFFNTRDGLPDAISVNTNSHVHSTWAFTATGEYTLTWEFTGTLADGTEVSTGHVDYHWVVGDLPGEDPDPDPDPDPGTSDLDGRLVLDEGHVDVLATTFADGALALDVKDGTKLHSPDTVHRDPDDVAFHAGPASELTLSQELVDYWQVEDRYDAGDKLWWLPSSQQQGVLFPGWNSDIPAGTFRDDALDLEFTDFSGPGDLLMFIPGDGIEPTVLYADTADGLPDTIATRSKTHAHADWLFSAPGVYTLTWQAEGVLADGTPVSSAPEKFVFVVGPWPGEDPDPGDPGNPDLESTQTITATVDTDAGGLVISVDPADRDVVLPAMALDPTATRWTTEGELRPVTVTDTRSADPGWNAAAQVSQFTSGAGGFSSTHLGWRPGVVSTGASQQVAPGPAVAGALDGGPGLATSQILAAAAAGSGNGTCVLGADLHLDLPTDVESGTYTALVTFTAI
ncbi:choice-of-anchor M domain-containing protein [Glycomyces niveus]|uniref:Choice-of-anchor M domain-containing protein n=1 Tax=Glycomyces niveus TaxID=2820287 RepID=A0ABS3TZC5_9ACTN|nr:choice-of-anchor M domain-containing protein [Glycomyces sp. NEAU-S30]MBO3731860.1 choice-of-anchor M domain-containing protein [Glycomyces sp. NEAU-S30]